MKIAHVYDAMAEAFARHDGEPAARWHELPDADKAAWEEIITAGLEAAEAYDERQRALTEHARESQEMGL